MTARNVRPAAVVGRNHRVQFTPPQPATGVGRQAGACTACLVGRGTGSSFAAATTPGAAARQADVAILTSGEARRGEARGAAPRLPLRQTAMQ